MIIGSSSIPHCSPYYALGQKMTINIILKGKCSGVFIVNPYKRHNCNHDIVVLGASQGSCAVLAYHVLINEKTLQVMMLSPSEYFTPM